MSHRMSQCHNITISQAWRAAGTKSIKDGENSGFKEAFGMEFWDYHETRPAKTKQFDESMGGR